MKILASFLLMLVSGTTTSTIYAESMRCKTSFAQIGDTKADILEKCGDPVITDSFCRPLVSPPQIHATQDGNNNIQNNIAVQACEDIEVWTYKPGKGQFITHLYFVHGQLRKMEYGDRIK